MATRFYLSATDGSDTTPGFAAWTRTSEAVRRRMSPTKDGSTIASKTFWANANAAANDTCLAVQYQSAILAPGTAFVTTDTIKCYIRAQESAANDNINRQPICLKVYNGTYLHETLFNLAHVGPNTTEWATTLTNKTWADGDVLTAGYTTVSGDYLVLEVGGQVSSAGGTTVTGTLSLGSSSASDIPENETNTTADNPWFEISRNISFVVQLAGQCRGAISRNRGAVTQKMALAGTSRGRGLRSIGQVRLVKYLTGTSRGAPARNRSTSIVLAYRAQASRGAAGRLRAQGTTRQALAGQCRSISRLQATLGQKVALTGRLVAAPRCYAALSVSSATTPLAGQLRSTGLLRGTLTSRQPLAGAIRGTSLHRGILTTKQALAGRLHATPRQRALSISLVYKATPSRGRGGRLRATLGQKVALAGRLIAASRCYGTLGSPQAALAGRLRAGARLQATLSQKVPLSGRLLAAPLARASLTTKIIVALTGRLVAGARQRALGMVLAYKATPARGANARLRGALGASATVSLAGVCRGAALRLPGLDITIIVRVAEVRGASGRLRATLAQRVALAGRVRVTERARGGLTQKVALSGRLMGSAGRLRATLSVTPTASLAGQLRATSRQRGVLTQKVSLTGRTVTAPRLRGTLSTGTIALTGRVVGTGARARGTLTQHVALAGLTRTSARLSGAAMQGAVLAFRVTAAGVAALDFTPHGLPGLTIAATGAPGLHFRSGD